MNKFQSRSFQKSVMYALNGVRLAFRSQRNFRKHLVIALLTFAIAFFLRVSIIEFCIILFVRRNSYAAFLFFNDKEYRSFGIL